MQIIIIALLSVFVIVTTTNGTRDTVVNDMKAITQERSQIVMNYVQKLEDMLTAFSRAGEVNTLLQNPTDEKAVENAQKLTQVMSNDIEYIDGLYVSEWDTHVLTHTQPSAIGIIIRKGDSLKALQKSMLDANGVYNTGIVLSPASGKQVVSMYRAIFNDAKEPIGFVGCAVYTTGLVEMLDSLKIEGLNDTTYTMINSNTKQYIFTKDPEKTAAEVEEDYAKKLCEQFKGSTKFETGFVEYERDGKAYISSYHYMPGYEWIFLVENSEEEIFATTSRLKTVLIGFATLSLTVLTVVTLLIIAKMTRPLKPIEDSIIALKELDITERKDLQKFEKKNDELGSITRATDSLVDSLRSIIEVLQSCSNTLDLGSNALTNADMAELADAIDLGSIVNRRAGSSPVIRTNKGF